MKPVVKFKYCLLCIIFLFSSLIQVYSTNYYLDNIEGQDANSGTSHDLAWKTLTKINGLTFSPGDSILLKYGSIWNDQQLAFKGSGSEGLPIVVDAYGEAGMGKPILNGNGAIQDVVVLNNQEWIELRNLEITNYKEGDLITDPASFKRGIYIKGTDQGEIMHLHLVNLYIHSINGYGEGANAGKDCGGIFFEITGYTTPSWFSDFLIEGCHIYDVVRTGISCRSTWSNPDLGRWYPFLNVRIRNTIVEEAGFNGMIPRNSLGMVVEYCSFINNGLHGNGNAIFQWRSDSTIYQFNEAYGTYFNPEDHDAAGFDGGGYNTNSLIQYNYSHDNGLGGIVIGLGSGSTNDGARIRYNILQDNQRQAFRFSGISTNVTVSNNTIYIGPDISDVNIVYQKKLGDSPDQLSYHNNIFYVLGENCYYSFGESTRYSFSHNLFYGKHPDTEPYDPFKIISDPLLIAAGGGGIGRNSASAYKLSSASPGIDAGIIFAGDNGGIDFFGNSVPFNGVPDIGAHEWGGDARNILIRVLDESKSAVEGAIIWMEGYDKRATDADGEVVYNDLITGNLVGLTIEKSGYPLFAGGLESNPDDTIEFALSQNTHDLSFIVSDSIGNSLENASVILPGLDTLSTDHMGKVLFEGVSETEYLVFKTEHAGFQSVDGSLSLSADDTGYVSMKPRTAYFEIRNFDNAGIPNAAVSIDGIGKAMSDSRGVALIQGVLKNRKIEYIVEKPGFWPQSDSLWIGNQNTSVLLRLEENRTGFLVTDKEHMPIPEVAIVFLDKLEWTDENGWVEITEVPYGKHLQYQAYKAGYVTAEDSIIISGPRDTVFIQLELRNYDVAFSITDDSGNALENSLVTLSGYGIQYTDSLGKATFEGVLAAENIIFSISKTGYRDTINILNVADEDVLVDIELSGISNLINPLSFNNNMIFFPNPATDFVSLRLPDRDWNLSVFDVYGRLKYSCGFCSEGLVLDVSNWAAGVYLLRGLRLQGEYRIDDKLYILR